MREDGTSIAALIVSPEGRRANIIAKAADYYYMPDQTVHSAPEPSHEACSPSPCTRGEGRGEGSCGAANDARPSKGDPRPNPPPEYGSTSLTAGRERGPEMDMYHRQAILPQIGAEWNIFTWRLVSFMVGIKEPPYLNIIRTGA